MAVYPPLNDILQTAEKNHLTAFSISASVEDEVREKIKRLRVPRGLSVRTALVYAGELAPEVAERGYFDALVPVERLLGLPVRQ